MTTSEVSSPLDWPCSRISICFSEVCEQKFTITHRDVLYDQTTLRYGYWQCKLPMHHHHQVLYRETLFGVNFSVSRVQSTQISYIAFKTIETTKILLTKISFHMCMVYEVASVTRIIRHQHAANLIFSLPPHPVQSQSQNTAHQTPHQLQFTGIDDA